MKKAGVSLVTVLLFMLVATIAATATYKWITSEGHSSASRMLEREAYQSSVAGVESAISWMTYHANDVGALIHQYKTNGNSAVSLDNRLAPLVRAGQNFHVWLTGVSTEKSTYKLKLVSEGIARDGGASHREVAIVNVDGLYRVKIPSTSTTINFNKAFQGDLGNLTNSPTFQSAIVNGNFSGNQPTVTEHMIVTGNVTLAGPAGGASGLAGADLYVRGNVSFNGNNSIGSGNNVAYVGGTFSCSGGQGSIYIGGDLYVHGNIANDCGIYTEGNLTANGQLDRNGNKEAVDKDGVTCTVYGNTSSLCVNGHLVFTENGSYNFEGNGTGRFKVGLNLYAPDIIEAHCGSGCNDDGGNRKSSVGGYIYRHNMTNYYSVLKQQKKECDWDGWTWTNCHWTPYDPNYGIYMQYTTQTELGNDTESGKQKRLLGFSLVDDDHNKTSTALPVWDRTRNIWKDIGGNYWSNIDRMNSLGHLIKHNDDGTNTVPQAILLKNMANNQDQWLQNKSNQACYNLSGSDNLANFDKNVSTSNGYIIDGHSKLEVSFWEDVQKCYEKLSQSDDLYNNYLVLTFAGGSGSNMDQTITKNGNPILNGKFIFYFTGRSTSDFFIPPTTSASSILLYLPGGASKLFSGGPRGDGWFYNYFVYAGGTTATTLSNLKVNGSVIMQNGSQATVADGNVNLEYNGTVLQALADAGFIEENPDYTLLANPSAAGGGMGAAAGGAQDDYYIAVAPQLSINLETQYASNESIDNLVANGQAAAPTFIVLPRIIYLSNNPQGNLDQYYNVIPLNPRNNSSTVQNLSVSCGGAIPTSGKLVPTAQHKLASGNYTCYASGSVDGTESSIPFYVVVTGADDGVARVSFAEGQKELKKTDPTYNVQLRIPTTTGVAEQYTVKVDFPSYDVDQWEVGVVGTTDGACNAGSPCFFKISSNQALHNIFTVKNKNATNQLVFQILSADGCDVGAPYIETIMVGNSITVNRKSLEEWCTANGDGTTDADKAKCAKVSAPDCDISAQWVTANGQMCGGQANGPWTCKNTGSIQLEEVQGAFSSGCEVVIPGPNKANDPPSAEISEVDLYASLKARPFTFAVRYVTDKGENSGISDSRPINIHVERQSEGVYSDVSTNNCKYSDFNDATKNAANCQVQVYYGDRVTLSFPNPTDATKLTPPSNFNYWMCESGPDCPASKIPSPTNTYVMSITGADVVDAHFEESDKHCFFDEFRSNEGYYTNRSAILCGASGSDAEYCIDAAGTHTTSKWKLLSGSSSDIEFNGDGRISLVAKSTRIKKESEKPSVTIMSRAQAGAYGTLKAQFQVPREGISSGGISKSTVKQSGFILRSRSDGSSYLMLNIFSDKNGDLKARLCLNGDSPCKEKQIGTASVNQGDIILVAATIRKANANDALGVNDVLDIYAYTSAYSSAYQMTSFDLSQNDFDGIQNLASQSNEYVGFRLSDQNFKLYGIGWKSDDYVSQCWDSYPTITCSFKAKYAGGIVPKNQFVTPWVGFSKWFGENGNTCEPEFYYNGSDAGCNGYAQGSSGYNICPSDGYKFTGDDLVGPHGVGSTNVARAGASGSTCTISGESAPWATSEVPAIAAHCGPFWVGAFTPCTEHVPFAKTIDGAEGTYFAQNTSGDAANFREAELVVKLDNTGAEAAEVSVYLFSKNLTDGYIYGSEAIYSQAYTASVSVGNGNEISVPVADISNVDGFDPEHVAGAYVKFDAGSGINVTSVYSRCPYALSLKACNATYNSATDKWTVTATVNNGSVAGTLDVTNVNIGGADNDLTTMDNQKNCVAGECTLTGNSVQTWEFQNLLSHTPYTYITGDNESVDYKFTLTLTDRSTPAKPAEGSPCETKTTVSRITTSCSIPPDKQTIGPGQGLPAMTYSITGCPTATAQEPKCGYTIKLMDGTTLVATVKSNSEVSGDVSNTSPVNAYNNDDQHLLTLNKTYKLVLESTNSEYPFASCEQEFSVAESTEGVVTGECEFNPSTVYTGNSTTLDITGVGESSKWDERSNNQISGTLSGGGGTQSVTIDRYNSGNVNHYSVTAPTTADTYTYSITYGGNTFCTATLTVQSLSDVLTATCPNISTYPLKSTTWGIQMNGDENLTKTVSRTVSIANVGSWNKDCSSDACPDMDAINAPATVSDDYTYSLTADGATLCSNKEYKVKNPLVCKVNGTAITNNQEIEMEEGGSFTFKAEWAYNYGNGTYTECTISGSNANKENDCYNNPSKFNSDVTISPSGTGDKEYSYSTTLSVSGVSAGPFTCNWKMKVKKAKPAFDCPTNLRATISESNNVTIIPQNVSGCDEGGSYCYYKIEGWGASGTESTGYTNTTGALPSFTNSHTTTVGDTAIYVVSLRNSSGTTTKRCSATFAAAGAKCGCTCGTEACNSLVTGTNVGLEGTNSSVICVYGTEITTVNVNSNGNVLINGEDAGSYCGDANGCASTYSGIEKIDGGYYMKIPLPTNTNPSNNWRKATVSGANANPCEPVSKPTVPSCSAPSTAKTGKVIKVSPSVTNCSVPGGCIYTISASGTNDRSDTYYGGDITFIGESEPGTYNYTLALRNSAGSAETPCAFSVTYSAPDPPTNLSLTKDCNKNELTHESLADGKDYKVTAVGSCKSIKFNCPYGGGGCSVQVNDGTPVSGGDNTSNNSIEPPPAVNDILHVTGDVSKICCAIGW
ncbi:MAG: hypothetical protein IJ896_05465 [Fibrobacter sp.]|nr:hypothetical protein [Fibrobacter sp.]